MNSSSNYRNQLGELSRFSLKRLKSSIDNATTDSLIEDLEKLKMSISEPTHQQQEMISSLRLQASTTLYKENRSHSDFVTKVSLPKWIEANQFMVSLLSKINLEKSDIFKLQSILVSAEKVKLRDHVLQGGNCDYPPPEDLPALWEIFENEVLSNDQQDHSIIEASKLYHWTISLHFFSDANGRLARLLADWKLIQAGFPPLCFRNDVSSFIAASDKERNHDSTTAVQRIYDALIPAYEILGATLKP